MDQVIDAVVTDPLRERLIEYIAHLHAPRVKPVDGVVAISAESMADALLPFLHDELANRAPTQDAYDAACKALWKHRANAVELRAALNTLVRLKDGPRDESYRQLKDGAWHRAREVLARTEDA